MHDGFTSQGKLFNPVSAPIPFQKTYEGCLTTQSGPLASNLDLITESAKRLHELHLLRKQIGAPEIWQQPTTHSLQALQSPWDRAVFTLQDTMFQTTIDFFLNHLTFKYTLIPGTTDSISSLMDLGSGSQRMQAAINAQDTYLPDSMQFGLEYLLRVKERIKGAYYVGCSSRGGDTDHMHVNQFYHVECELLGILNDGIDVAERYIIAVTRAIKDKHMDTIRAVAGNTSHVDDLLSLAIENGGHFPRINLSDALLLNEIVDADHAWEYAVSSDPRKGRALTRVGEQILVEKFGGAVWLTEMNHLSVPFYQAFVPHSNNSKAVCEDLLFGCGEVLIVGQRHTTACEVGKALEMHEVPWAKYEWYLSMRDAEEGGEYLQTTGWSMRMERYLAWIMKREEVR